VQAGIAELEAGIFQLEGQLRYWMDKLNPPRPPQLTPDLPAVPAKKPTGRKPGTQAGYPPHLKKRLPLSVSTEGWSVTGRVPMSVSGKNVICQLAMLNLRACAASNEASGPV
jgi:hypothetical protein